MSPVYDAGEARGVWTVDTSKGEANIARAEKRLRDLEVLQQRVFQAKAPTSAPTGGGGGQALPSLSAAQARAAQTAARLATEQGRAAIAAQRLATEENKTAREAANTAAAQDRAAKSALQLAAAQKRATAAKTVNGLPILPRTLESFGTEAISQFKSGLLGIVGPAAIVGGALTVLSGTVETLKQAFTFKAELDATNLAIQTNLEGVRDSGAVFQDAAKFADKYRLTQKETSEILASSTDILRVSTASVGDLEASLLRLQSRDVSKPISEAARALRELNSGDVTSIKELFNVPAAEALRMKNEIAAGGDAVQVLNSFLDRAGVSMAVLENRAKGAAGALNEQKIAQEQLTLAQAKIASSAGGIFFVQALTRQYQGLANLLNGDALAGLQSTGREFAISAQGAAAYATALAQGKSAVDAQAAADAAATAAANSFADAQRNGGGGTFELTQALDINRDALSKDAIAKLDSEIKTAGLAAQQAQLDADSRAAAQGLLGAGDQALILAQKYGIATEQAQFLINAQQALSNATALADQRVGERDPGNRQTAAEFNAFSKLRRTREQEDARVAQAEAARVAAARARLEESQAVTSAQKIALAKRRLNQAANEADRIDAQANLNQLQQQQTKASGAGAKPSVGLSGLTRTNIKLSGDERAQLQAVNSELAKSTLTAQQRNQLEIQRLDLIEKIGDEEEKQRRASIDAQLGAVKDAQARLKEAREAAGLERALAAGRLSGAQSEAAKLRLSEISLEQQKRALDIQKDAQTAGLISPTQVAQAAAVQAGAAPAALPIPNLATLPPVQAPSTTVNLTVNIDKNGAATVVQSDPGVILNLLGSAINFRNLSGGAA